MTYYRKLWKNSNSNHSAKMYWKKERNNIMLSPTLNFKVKADINHTLQIIVLERMRGQFKENLTLMLKNWFF